MTLIQAQTLVLANKRGLHARASAKFVTVAAEFKASIKVSNAEGAEVGGTSIMGLMMLGVACNETINISATGEEAEAAVSALAELINRKFDEE